MIVMRIADWIKLFFCILAVLAMPGCFFDNDGDSGTGSVNVAGTWTASVSVEGCSPANVCQSAGFQQGQTVRAVMALRQNGNTVEGTYTYEGAPISADVNGRVSGTQLVLNGSVSNPLGKATVDFVGAVSGSVIDAAVSHNVTLNDGTSGTVSGSGDFVR